ncbi:MAG: TolC family protein [Planctomycetota bacterium]
MGLLLLALLAGCVSLDPAPDYDEASTLVGERSAWKPSWNAPWADGVSTWDGKSPLTLDQAVTIAFQNNRALRGELENIASARADLVQSGLLPNPVLSASLGHSKVGTAVSFGLIQELNDLLLRPQRKKAAAAALRGQVLSVSDLALRLVTDVRDTHARVVHGQRGIALTHSHIELVRRGIAVAEKRLQAGEGTQLDVNRLTQELLSLQADLVEQRLGLQTARRSLLKLLGMADASADWEAEDTGQAADGSSISISESEAMKRAAQQRLDVQAARAAFEQRRHELSAETLGAIPDVSLGPSYESDEDNLKFLGGDLEVEIPIFDTNRARIAKARSELRKAKAEADQVIQAAVNQTRSAWLAWQSKVQQVKFFRDRVLTLARENLALSQRSFRAGQVDLTVVLDTQREVIQAEFKLNSLELDAATSLADLEYAAGGRL